MNEGIRGMKKPGNCADCLHGKQSKDSFGLIMTERIAPDPAALIRMERSGGGYVYSGKECMKLLDLWLDKAEKLWEREYGAKVRYEVKKELMKELKVREDHLGRGAVLCKPSGRGKLFWVDSE